MQDTKNNPFTPAIAKVSADESAKVVHKPRRRKSYKWAETDGQTHAVTVSLGVKAALPEGFTETRISDCAFGCKVYTNGKREIVAHNSAYGCRVGL